MSVSERGTFPKYGKVAMQVGPVWPKVNVRVEKAKRAVPGHNVLTYNDPFGCSPGDRVIVDILGCTYEGEVLEGGRKFVGPCKNIVGVVQRAVLVVV